MRNDLLTITDPDAECVKIPRCRPMDDRLADAPWWMDLLMGQAVDRLALQMDGGTTSLDPLGWRTMQGGPKSKAPHSSLAGDIDRWKAEYARTRTNRQRLHVIWWAQQAARHIAAGPPRGKVKGTAEWRAEIYAASGSCRAIGRIYGCTHDTVRRIKREGPIAPKRSGGRSVALVATLDDTSLAA